MKYLVVIVIVLLLLSDTNGQDIREIDRQGIVELTSRSSDTTYVVNFWATWCSPCVKEIGYFEELHRQHGTGRLKVFLVSLDFPNQLDRRVIPFLEEKDITAPVVLMTDLNYNEWIDRVDPSWSGAIPATLIYRDGKRIFLEKELSREELMYNVNQILN